jgi:hypothetical protein
MAQQKKQKEFPARQAKEVSLRQALELTGRSLFPDEWTGQEIHPAYCQLFRHFQGRLDEQEVKDFLQSDLNDASVADKFQDPKDFLSSLAPAKSREPNTPLYDMDGRKIVDWPSDLTSNTMSGTYQRFRCALEISLHALQDGSVKALSVNSQGQKESVPSEQWRSRHFLYDIEKNLISQNGHTHCYIPTDELKAIVDECVSCEPDLIADTGRRSLAPYLRWCLEQRLKDGVSITDVADEVEPLKKAVLALMPKDETIKNIIRNYLKRRPHNPHKK